MAKKNNKKLNKLDKWLPICAVGGTVIGSILSIALENVIYLIFGSCMGLMIGVILGAIGVYEPLVSFAGAGASVPLTGFGYNLAKGVKEAVDQDGFLGILTGGLKAAAGGISAAILSGLLVSLLFRDKDKS